MAEWSFIHWYLSMEQSTWIFEKNTILNNTFKHNLKKKYLDNLAGSQDLQDYYWCLLILLTHLFIYVFIYSFIHLFLCFLLTYFSFSFIQSSVFNFYFTYSPFPLPPVTVYFILFIMHLFCNLVIFLTCSYFYYIIII